MEIIQDTPSSLPHTLPFLQERERQILFMLSRKWTYKQIAAKTHLRLPTLHVHCHHIRQKTGIRSTRSWQQCYDYLRGMRHHPEEVKAKSLLPPTAKQIEVLRLLSMGRSYKETALALNMGAQTVQNHASAACKRVGITCRTHMERLQAIRQWLAQHDREQASQINPMEDKDL